MGPFYYLFIGLFIGLAIGEIIANVFVARESKYRFLGIVISYALTTVLCIYIFTINAGFISLGIIIVVIGLSVYMYLKPSSKTIKTHNKKDYLYINHCWNCKSSIDSRIDIRCPKCRKFYICSKCGMCYCDSEEYKRLYGGKNGQE